ncbi:MAG: Mrp/NBP35 family ATP-binding protein [Prolixibacteraceae bacterium]
MNKSENQIKNIILIASGKGGVGKTTVATNLAVALAREGYQTGLLDADLYGPSIPLAFGLNNHRLEVETIEGKEIFTPIEKYGVKVMSLGFLMKKEDAVIWRGPMASKALTQLLEDTRWEVLDFLIVDLPPGTGDISITLAQKLPQAKAIIVITPQQMAIADGRKAAALFNSNGINIPILGIVENMSYFIPEQHPDEQYLLFGSGGGEQLSNEINVPLLAKIPLVADVCGLEDAGKTIFASSNKTIVKVFEELAEKLYDPEHALQL